MSATAEARATRSDLLFEQLIEQVRIEVDSALDAIAADDDAARRICTRDLRFEPDEDALAVIVEIAGYPALSGPLRELPRRLLTLRVLAERELAGLFAGSELDAQRLRRGTVVIASVLGFIEPLQHDLRSASGGGGPDHQRYLATCQAAMRLPREDLCAGLLLAPRLEEFALAEDDLAVRAIAPTLGEGEARRIAAFVDGRDGARGEAHRACFDALVLRSLLEERLARIDEFIETAGTTAPEADAEPVDELEITRLDAEAMAELETLLGRVDADRVAYQFVSRRLQKQKDMALVAGLKSLVEELGHVSKGLFSAYRQVIARSRDAATLAEGNDERDVVQADELFRQSVAAEIEVERRVAESSDEVCLRALRQLRDGESRLTIRGTARRLRRAAKNRTKPLIGIAAVLLLASVWINLAPSDGTSPEKLTYADFASGLNVSAFEAAEGVLLVQVSGWALLDTIQRRTRAEALASIAETKGYASMFVTEENGYPAATWSPEQGTRLTAAGLTAPLPR